MSLALNPARRPGRTPRNGVDLRRPRGYHLAASLLRDLQALAERQGDQAAFRRRFGESCAQHQRKPSLLDRFDQAGLPS